MSFNPYHNGALDGDLITHDHCLTIAGLSVRSGCHHSTSPHHCHHHAHHISASTTHHRPSCNTGAGLVLHALRPNVEEVKKSTRRSAFIIWYSLSLSFPLQPCLGVDLPSRAPALLAPDSSVLRLSRALHPLSSCCSVAGSGYWVLVAWLALRWWAFLP